MGGANAPTSIEASAKGIWRLALELKQTQSGNFFDFTGKALPW
jgi:hypothetical protein